MTYFREAADPLDTSALYNRQVGIEALALGLTFGETAIVQSSDADYV